MIVTAPAFRGSFPAFSNMTIYPDPVINFWFGLAEISLDAGRWGNLLPYGLQLFVAHNLSLEYNANAAGKLGANPGFVTGPVTSGSVDKVSYSRDIGAALDPKNGHWNLSVYGLRYIRLVNMIGAGPIQVSPPGPNELGQSMAGAWQGPYGGWM